MCFGCPCIEPFLQGLFQRSAGLGVWRREGQHPAGQCPKQPCNAGRAVLVSRRLAAAATADAPAPPCLPACLQVVELDDDAMMAYLDVSSLPSLAGAQPALRQWGRRPGRGAAAAPAQTVCMLHMLDLCCTRPKPTAFAPLRYLLQGELPDEATIKRLLRKGTIEGKFVPMCCGTAFKNKGVQTLLDAVVDYLPAPTDLPDVKGSAVDDPEKASCWERKSGGRAVGSWTFAWWCPSLHPGVPFSAPGGALLCTAHELHCPHACAQLLSYAFALTPSVHNPKT